MDVGIILRFPYTRCACKIYNANQYNFSRKSNYTTVETDNDMSKKSCPFLYSDILCKNGLFGHLDGTVVRYLHDYSYISPE